MPALIRNSNTSAARLISNRPCRASVDRLLARYFCWTPVLATLLPSSRTNTPAVPTRRHSLVGRGYHERYYQPVWHTRSLCSPVRRGASSSRGKASVELCTHASGNKHGQPSGSREQSGVRVDPTGPVTMVRRGGDEQDASSGPNRGLWRQPEGLKVRPGWVIFRVLGLASVVLAGRCRYFTIGQKRTCRCRVRRKERIRLME
jgi:hypothetical protein